MRYLSIFVLAFVMLSCGKSDSITKEQILELEDQLKETSMSDQDKVNELRDSLLNSFLTFYHQNPDDQFSAECLDKVHLIYSAKMDYPSAAKYADTLLEKYPDYINRLMVIESQFNTYDMFIQPRNKEKAKYYLELLLKEDKNMDSVRRSDFEYRLEYIDLTIEQLIERNMTELN